MIKTKNNLHTDKSIRNNFDIRENENVFLKWCVQLLQLKQIFFIPLNEGSPKRSTFKILESFLIKTFSSILWSLLKIVSLSFGKLVQWGKLWIVVSTLPQLETWFNVSWKLDLINQRCFNLSLGRLIRCVWWNS